MKPGDRFWKAVPIEHVDADGGVWFRDWDDDLTRSEPNDMIPDSPMLPAVARWLAALPEWIDAAELATALQTVLVMSKAGQAMTCYDAVPALYERQEEFVEASDNIQPHGWEALESLIAALTEGRG